MNGVSGSKRVGGPRLQRFACGHSGCAATFSREWRLTEHDALHSGAVRAASIVAMAGLMTRTSRWCLSVCLSVCPQRPCLCPVDGCGRRFSRKSHLRRHVLQHKGAKVSKWVSLPLMAPLPEAHVETLLLYTRYERKLDS